MAVVGQCAYEKFTAGADVDAMVMEEKIKGAHLRGKKYTVSQDGFCPRCGNSNRLYVILDKLFPMGDMPEILHTLIAKGRAILWSSQEKEGYKDPPTFLCRGFCPPDPLGAGFNVNWDNVSLDKTLESLDAPVQKAIIPASSPQGTHSQGEESSQDEASDNPYVVLDDFQGNKSEFESTSQSSITQSSSDKEEENDEEEEVDNDDDDDELDEEELIKQMLAKEQQKLSQPDDDDDDDDDDEPQEVSAVSTNSENVSDQSSSSSHAISSTATATASTEQTSSTSAKMTSTVSAPAQYPVSSTGRCPYCGSTDVKYIVVVSENTPDSELPQSLQQLLKSNHAFKMAKGESEPPSFQCQKCQYGFNLNWSKTNLEVIFGLPPAASSAATTSAASYTSTASTTCQTPYMPPTAYPSYPPPSVPPLGYPPPVRVPPPVPAVPYGYPPATYPAYHGSYYPPPAVPPPVGSYLPYASPGLPPPGIPYHGVPLPGIPPPGVPLRIPPPGIPPPRISPLGIPPPGLPPPMMPGYPTPAVPSVAPRAWGSYPQSQPMYHTPSRYPPPPARGHLPPPGVRPYYPQQQHLRPPRPGAPRPWYRGPAHVAVSSAAAPPQHVAGAQQVVEGEIGEKAAARFEMVLNQIDQAKARVRHEKEQMIEFQKAVHGNQAYQHTEEPNALTDEGQKMPEYEEKPPGDDDTGFGSSVIITQSLEEEKVVESLESSATAERPVSPSQVTPSDLSEHTEAIACDSDVTARDHYDTTAHESEADTRDVLESAVSGNDDGSKEDQNVDNVDDEPIMMETVPETVVPARGSRTGRSKKQATLLSPPAATSTRQTRRSRKSGAAVTPDDTDSTAAEEEAVTATGRSRRSRKTKPPSREVERLDTEDDREEGMEASDVEMKESSDEHSQSSVFPQTESDSIHEVPSESIASSSEPEAADADVVRPQRGRPARGRKRKQEAAVLAPTARKSRRMAAEERHDEDKEEAEDMMEERPAVVIQEEDTEMTVSSARVGRSRRGASGGEVKQLEADNSAVNTAEGSNNEQNVDGSREATDKLDVQEAKIQPKRQSRRSRQLPQESDVVTASETATGQQTKAPPEEEVAQSEETTNTRRTRKSAPKHVSPETDKGSNNRRTRKSAQLSSQESEMSDTEQHQNSDQTQENDSSQDANKATVIPQEEKEMKLDASSEEQEEKAGRRTRKTRKSSASHDESSGSREVFLSPESDALMAKEEAGDIRQTRTRKSPAVRDIQTTESTTPALEEDEHTVRTRKSRKSSASNGDAKSEDVQLSAEPGTPEDSASSRRTRRNKAKPTVHESSDLSQESDDLTAEDEVEEQAPVMTPRGRASKKTAPVKSPETVTKRVTRARQKR